MDEAINSDYKERKAFYSNNGPGIDLYAPADETLAAGMRADNGDQLGTETNYSRYNSDFVDRYFNGTSAAAPVVAGLVALFLESKPDATSSEVKDYLKNHASKVIPSMWEDTTTDDTDADYWRGDFNNRGAASRVLFDPTASDTRPTFANVSGGESIITSGLVLNLDANNYTSGSTWTDTSGQDNNGTINGATYNSENGGYFDFDGTNDYVEISGDSSLLLTGDCTIEFWVKPHNVSSGTQGLIGNDYPNFGYPNAFVIVLNHASATSKFALFNKPDSSTRLCETSSLSNDVWYHIVFSRISSTITPYTNGVAGTSGSSSSSIMLYGGSNYSFIGKYWNGEFDGNIAVARVYKGKGLTASEVLQNFDVMRGRFESKPLIVSGVSYSLT